MPAIQLDLSEAQKTAFSIADNKLASLADWDDEKLRLLLEKLKLENFDLPTIGYSDAELEALLAQCKEINWDDFKEYLGENADSGFEMLQLKLTHDQKEKLQEAIAQYAAKNQITDDDTATMSGKVFCRLLEIK